MLLIGISTCHLTNVQRVLRRVLAIKNPVKKEIVKQDVVQLTAYTKLTGSHSVGAVSNRTHKRQFSD